MTPPATGSSPVSIAVLLAENPIFRRLSDEHRALLASAFDAPVCVQEREPVLTEGHPIEHFGILASGQLSCIRAGSPDRVLESGAYFGLQSLFSDVTVESSVTLVPEKASCVVYTMRRANLYSLFNSNPVLAQSLLPAMARMLSDSTGAPKASSATARSASPSSKSRPFKVRVFDTKQYQACVMRDVNASKYNFDLEFIEEKLSENSVHLAYGADAVCVFVHDCVSASVAEKLKASGIELVVYRCAGYDTCDVPACERLGLSVARVPSYSPNAIAEHATALMLALNRRLIQASIRVHNNNFTLDSLTGFNMLGKTVGVIGTGRIGACLIRIMLGFGCNVLCYDMYESPAVKAMPGVRYVSLDELLGSSDIISLHCLLDQTSYHMINAENIAKMKRGVMIINTARGPLIDTTALIEALRSGHVGMCGLDVVEGEADYFYENMSDKVMGNDNIARLQSFTNVMITSHQAYLTVEALSEIAKTTFENVTEFIEGKRMKELTNNVFPR